MKHAIVTECLNMTEVRDSLVKLRLELMDNYKIDQIQEADIDTWEVELRRLISFFA